MIIGLFKMLYSWSFIVIGMTWEFRWFEAKITPICDNKFGFLFLHLHHSKYRPFCHGVWMFVIVLTCIHPLLRAKRLLVFLSYISRIYKHLFGFCLVNSQPSFSACYFKCIKCLCYSSLNLTTISISPAYARIWTDLLNKCVVVCMLDPLTALTSVTLNST